MAKAKPQGKKRGSAQQIGRADPPSKLGSKLGSKEGNGGGDGEAGKGAVSIEDEFQGGHVDSIVL